MIDGEALNARLLLHVVFKKPDAGGDGDPTNEKLGFVACLYRRDKRLLHEWVVQLAYTKKFRLAEFLERDGGFCADIVEAGQARLMDGLAYRRAALAAKVALFTFRL